LPQPGHPRSHGKAPALLNLVHGSGAVPASLRLCGGNNGSRDLAMPRLYLPESVGDRLSDLRKLLEVDQAGNAVARRERGGVFERAMVGETIFEIARYTDVEAVKNAAAFFFAP